MCESQGVILLGMAYSLKRKEGRVEMKGSLHFVASPVWLGNTPPT